MAFDASSFSQIPLNLFRPGPRVEFDTSKMQSGLAKPAVKVLVCGQRLTTGTAAAGVAVQVLSAAHARSLFGQGSMLAEMFSGWFANDNTIEVWGIGLSDVGGGTAATGTFVVTGPATAAGTLSLMVADQTIIVPVSSGMTATQVATAIAAAINAIPDLAVTAASSTGTVTVTARHKGTESNFIYLAKNFHQGDIMPAGLTVTVTAMSGGATNPDASAIITAIGDGSYQAFVTPWNDDPNMDIFEAALLDRAGASKMNYGVSFTHNPATYSTVTTAAASRNSPYCPFTGMNGSPSTPWKIAAAVAAQVMYNAGVDPARPFNTLVLKGILAPLQADRFDNDERELLLKAGVATLTVNANDQVCIERLVTSYKTNAQGLPDTGLKDLNSILTLFYLSWSMNNMIITTFPRHKLADDGTNFDPGSSVATPSLIKGEIVALAQAWEKAGLIEQLGAFIAGLNVARDANDRNRVNVFMRPDLVNGLQVTATLIQPVL